jgi:hypothetical protein
MYKGLMGIKVRLGDYAEQFTNMLLVNHAVVRMGLDAV